ncbi:MAG: high-potential iron-sulfur protein [Pseudomonadota bacterium]
MHEDDMKTDEQRRRLVKLAAGSAVVLPLSGLVACSGGDDGKTVAEKAADAAESAADKAAAVADGAADAVSDAADSAGEMAGDAMDKAGEMAGDAKDAVADAADAAGDMAGDAMDKAGEMAGDAKDAAKEAAGSAMDAAGDAVDSAKDTAGDMMDSAKDAVSGTAGGLPKLKEDDAVASALGYKHDASKIDMGKYPGRGTAANEACNNCALFIAGEDGWGACSIFAGKAVNANGWCASYNRKG